MEKEDEQKTTGVPPSDAPLEEVHGHVHVALDAVTESKGSDSDEDDPRTVTGIASSGTLDRDADVIPLEAWNLAEISRQITRGMPMFFSHMQRSLPIGKVTKVWKDAEANAVRFRGTLMPSGMYALADQVWSMLKGGFLTSVSIGFLSRDYDWIEGAGRRFKALELLEISIVPIPANRDALVTQLSNAKAFDATYNQTAYAAFLGSGVPEVKAVSPVRRHSLARDIEILRLRS